MVIFMSQAPILSVLVLVALVELMGMKVRRNILVLSALTVACLGASALVGGRIADGFPPLPRGLAARAEAER